MVWWTAEQIESSVLEATVFAPNNAAFDKIARDLSTTVDDFLKRQDIEDILKYHVAPGMTLRVWASFSTRSQLECITVI
jgi:uncharacterized surface protein with fasciclin (FAS1) repeats